MSFESGGHNFERIEPELFCGDGWLLYRRQREVNNLVGALNKMSKRANSVSSVKNSTLMTMRVPVRVASPCLALCSSMALAFSIPAKIGLFNRAFFCFED